MTNAPDFDINGEAPTLMMIGLGSAGKRTVPAGLEQRDDRAHIKELFVTAWIAVLPYEFNLTDALEPGCGCRKALTDLAVHLDVIKPREQTMINILAALMTHVWPNTYSKHSVAYKAKPSVEHVALG